MSAYAFMLGIYPDALNGIEVHADQLDGAIPVTSKDINSIRPDCGLQTPSSKKFEALDLWPGNKDHAFLSKALEQYPGLKQTILDQINKAEKDYKKKYESKLFRKLEEYFGKAEGDVTFQNALLFLDDYYTAKANKKPVSFEFDASTEEKIQVYYAYYFGHGFLENDKINAVFTHSYLSQLIHILNARAQAEDDHKEYCNLLISRMKMGVFTGNHLTVPALLTVLGEENIDFKP